MSRGTAKDVATIIAAAGELVGRTRLQKTASLLEMTGLGYGFIFDYYKFGPYSDELVASLDRALALNYVSEQECRANWGGRYSIFRTPERRPTGNPARDKLIQIAREADAVALELAVTAGFLAKEGIQAAWTEVAHRKPEKSEYIAKAKALYAQLLDVPNVPNSLPKIV